MDPGWLAGLGQVYMGEKVTLSLGAYATVFQTEIFVISACAKECMGRAYTGEHIYICSDSQAALKALEALRVTPKLI
jgi:hypothetical protein